MLGAAGRLLLLLAAPALLAWGCGGPAPQPTPLDAAAPRVDDGLEALDDEAAAAARRAREAARRELPRLLPLDPAAVRWYEVRREEGARAHRAALLTAEGGGKAGSRVLLEAVGLTGPGEPTLRLWRGEDEVWLLPGGALGPEVGHAPYRAWTTDPSWDDGLEGKGRRAPMETVSTPLGELRAVRVEHARSGDVLVRHLFAPDHGLIGLEVVVRRQLRLRLDLVEVTPRGAPPGGYDASAPAALWQSVGLALRRADVDGLSRLMSPTLRGRARTSAWERVRDLAPSTRTAAPFEPTPADRVRAELGELLELDVRVRGAWAVDDDEAFAPAFVTVPGDDGAPRTVRGQVVLRWRPEGVWKWEDLRVP